MRGYRPPEDSALITAKLHVTTHSCLWINKIAIWKGVINIVQVIVRDNNVDQALRALKKKMQREGLFREMKLRRHYEKPSVKKARERSEAVRRHRKLERKRKERDGE